MSPKRIYSDHLHDIAHYATKAEEFVAGLDCDQFLPTRRRAWRYFMRYKSSEKQPPISPTPSNKDIRRSPGRMSWLCET